MPRRRKTLLIVICLLAVITVFWLVSKKSEPGYNGKTLTQWCQLWNHSDRNSELEGKHAAEEAVRQIGTNTLPLVMGWISKTPYQPGPKFFKAIKHVPWLEGKYYDQVYLDEDRYRAAPMIFAVLGPQSRSALPQLTEWIKTSPDDTVRHRAFTCAATMGDASLPLLKQTLADPSSDFCYLALHLIGGTSSSFYNFKTNGSVLIPHLFNLSTNSESGLALYSVTAIGNIGGNPDVVIPGLTNLLTSTNEWVRREAIRALESYADKASTVIPALQLMLNDRHASVRVSATNALQQILHP